VACIAATVGAILNITIMSGIIFTATTTTAAATAAKESAVQTSAQ